MQSLEEKNFEEKVEEGTIHLAHKQGCAHPHLACKLRLSAKKPKGALSKKFSAKCVTVSLNPDVSRSACDHPLSPEKGAFSAKSTVSYLTKGVGSRHKKTHRDSEFSIKYIQSMSIFHSRNSLSLVILPFSFIYHFSSVIHINPYNVKP